MFKRFFEVIINLFIFLPYFFSVSSLLKTLFAPWKNLTSHEKSRGLSMGNWLNNISFNLISRTIGFVMRFSILSFYLIVQIAYFVAVPFIIIAFIVLMPLLYVFALVMPSAEDTKRKAKNAFVSKHLLKEENRTAVEAWFEQWYGEQERKAQWWKLSNLFSIPPIARDWAVGYTPILDEYTQDLTNSTYQANSNNHMIGRNKEVKLIEEVLSKSDQANIILVGEEGVGKHTIINALTQKIYEGSINPLLAFKRILRLNMEKILTQHTDQKQREEFLEGLLQEAAEAGSVMLLIENIDKYVSFGQDRIDMTIPFERHAKSNKLQIIGITTPFLYEKYIFTNEKINHLFTKVDVAEITKPEALMIILDTALLLEKRYGVTIPYETLVTTIEKSDFFITTIPFPEKAMQLLDTACAYTVQIVKQKVVTPAIIDVVLSQKTHTPTSLSDQLKAKLLQLEQLLGHQVIHQEEALKELGSALRRAFLLLGKRKKPLSSFLFLGPTGVGKTETAKAIAQTFFGAGKNLLRFDMSLYQNKGDIPKLIGSIETLYPGQLATAIRETPYGVLLLDEIEKADKDLLNIFLTLLDEGYFTDGFGKRVDCKNLIVIATSNAGAEYLYQMLAQKQQQPAELQAVTSKIENLLATQPNQELIQSKVITSNDLITYLVQKGIFSPEFLNRFDGVIAYRPLRKESATLIARKMMDAVAKQIFELYKVQVNVSDATLQMITDKGYNPEFGGRNLERILRNEVEDKIAHLILENKVKEGDSINL